MQEPKRGAEVTIRPLHTMVQDGELAFGRFVKSDGRAVLWDRWWSQRLRDGDIEIVPAAHAKPVKEAK